MHLLLAATAALAGPLARRVPEHPGALAFSPEGDRLACISADRLLVLDLATGTTRALPLAPRFVDWAPSDNLLVVDEEGALWRLDPDTLQAAPVPSPFPATAAWGFLDGRWVVVLTATVEPSRIGTITAFRLTRLGRGEPVALAAWDPVIPTVRPDLDVLSGWLAADWNPVEGALTVPVFRDPPAALPSVGFVAVDPVTGQQRTVVRAMGDRATVSAGWSADGRRLLFTDQAGLLMAWDEQAGAATTLARQGHLPRESPAGDLLFLGGWLLDRQLTPTRQLARHPEALGEWSPRGDRIAVVDRGRLRVFAVDAAALEPDPLAEKLRELAELRLDRLIEDEDYATRRARLLAAAGRPLPDPEEERP